MPWVQDAIPSLDCRAWKVDVQISFSNRKLRFAPESRLTCGERIGSASDLDIKRNLDVRIGWRIGWTDTWAVLQGIIREIGELMSPSSYSNMKELAKILP